jgi:hypothetical protein
MTQQNSIPDQISYFYENSGDDAYFRAIGDINGNPTTVVLRLEDNAYNLGNSGFSWDGGTATGYEGYVSFLGEIRNWGYQEILKGDIYHTNGGWLELEDSWWTPTRIETYFSDDQITFYFDNNIVYTFNYEPTTEEYYWGHMSLPEGFDAIAYGASQPELSNRNDLNSLDYIEHYITTYITREIDNSNNISEPDSQVNSDSEADPNLDSQPDSTLPENNSSSSTQDNTFLLDPINNTESNSDLPLDNDGDKIKINRFQNSDRSGTYLFATEGESVNIRQDFPNFNEEGVAFSVFNQPKDDLIRMNRFQNSLVPGTYLFATEGESINIRQNFPYFFEEGIAFYTYAGGSNQGTEYYRFQNTSQPGTYIFVNETERQNILASFPNFVEEGVAFEVPSTNINTSLENSNSLSDIEYYESDSWEIPYYSSSYGSNGYYESSPSGSSWGGSSYISPSGVFDTTGGCEGGSCVNIIW